MQLHLILIMLTVVRRSFTIEVYESHTPLGNASSLTASILGFSGSPLEIAVPMKGLNSFVSSCLIR